MPLFGAPTPESLLNRNDSRNPATTCKGITSNGRPCRRSIAGNTQDGVLAVSTIDDDGESAAAAFYCWQHKNQADSLVDESATPSRKTRIVPLQERTSLDTLVERLGVLELDPAQDTPDPERTRRRKRRSKTFGQHEEPTHHIPRPPTWKSVQSPVIEVPIDMLEPEAAKARQARRREHAARPSRRERPKKKPSFWSKLCFGDQEDNYAEPVRPKRRARSSQRPEMEHRTSRQRQERRQSGTRLESRDKEVRNQRPSASYPREDDIAAPRPSRRRVYRDEEPTMGEHNTAPKQSAAPVPVSAPIITTDQNPNRKPLADKPVQPLNEHVPFPETRRLLSLIPPHLSPNTTSLLLTELSKPISSSDEPGYIYIFWLTPESQKSPSAETTASLLNSNDATSKRNRKESDAFLRAQPGVRENGGQKTILLKIGRARNVHRRMAQWENQCGYKPSLLRFYPHVSSPMQSPATTPDVTPQRPSLSPETSEYLRKMSETHARASKGTLPIPQQRNRHSDENQGQKQRRPSLSPQASENVRHVPNVKRVERLVHLELTDKRVKKECEACGRVHIEWFEVEASRGGVKGVDEVVRRWVDWSESEASKV